MSMETPRSSLHSVLRELAQDDDARHGTSRDVQARLLSEVRAMAARRRRRSYGVVALIAVAGVLMVMPRTTVPGMPPAAPPIAPPVSELREMTTAFLPLPGATPPHAAAYVVRLELPRTALARFGLGRAETLVSSRSPSTVLADVLVGEDGLARAVRFVHQE